MANDTSAAAEPADLPDPAVAAPTAGYSDLEIARLIGRVLTLAAKKLDSDFDWSNGDRHGQCHKLLVAAKGNGKLDAIEYRIAYWLSSPTAPFPF